MCHLTHDERNMRIKLFMDGRKLEFSWISIFSSRQEFFCVGFRVKFLIQWIHPSIAQPHRYKNAIILKAFMFATWPVEMDWGKQSSNANWLSGLNFFFSIKFICCEFFFISSDSEKFAQLNDIIGGSIGFPFLDNWLFQ